MRLNLRSFLHEESGATAIEYGILAGLIGVAIVLTIGGLKDKLVDLFETIGNALNAVV